MAGKIIVLAQFANPLEAELIKQELEAAGIPAFVSGQEASTLFGMGSSLGVQLHVAEENLARAEEVLAEHMGEEEFPEEEPNDSTDIRADKPEEPIDTTYRAQEKTASQVQTAVPSPPAEEEEPRGEASAEAPPAEADDDVASVAVTPDDVARRALYAAILGLIVCPLLMELYSFWLIINLPSYKGELTESGTWKVWAALFIDCVGLGLWALMIRSVLHR